MDNRKKKWIFPVILAVFFLTLVYFRINGSSIGMYHQYLGESVWEDPNLIAGYPRAIRSDEWMVQTPLMVSQIRTGSTGINHNIGDGLEYSIQSIPVKNWTLIFRPLFWGFYILPFDHAFSLYWWGKSLIFLLSSYFMALYFLKGKILPSILFSIAFLYSPFFQWWYSTAAIEMVSYSSILLLLFFVMLDFETSLKHWPLFLLGFVYFAFSMFLLLYPAFQIPLLHVILACVIGFLIKNNISFKKKENRKKLRILLLAVLFVALLVLVYYFQFHQPISVIQKTSYPGQRFINGGGNNLRNFLTGFYNFLLLEENNRLLPGVLNQSEGSSFIFLSLLALPWIFIKQIYQILKKNKLNFMLLMLTATSLLLIAWTITGFPRWFAQITLLYLVPPARAQIGIGWLNFLILCVYFGSEADKGFGNPGLRIVYTLSAFLLIANFGIYMSNIQWIGSIIIFGIAAVVALSIWGIISKKILVTSVLFVAFSLITSITVNPLYRGTEVLFQNQFSKTVRERSQDSSQKWVIYGDVPMANLILANGGHVYGGSFFYPNFSFLQALDPEGKYHEIYNRYSHIQFVYSSDNEPAKFKLVQPDFFQITINPCNSSLFDLGINNFVFNSEVDDQCLVLYKKVSNMQRTFYFYERRVAGNHNFEFSKQAAKSSFKDE